MDYIDVILVFLALTAIALVIYMYYQHNQKLKEKDAIIKELSQKKYRHDPSNDWSSSEAMIPLDALAYYVMKEGGYLIHQYCKTEDKDQLLDSWGKLDSDISFWKYHEKTSGNLADFIEDCFILNNKSRIEILEKSGVEEAFFLIKILTHINGSLGAYYKIGPEDHRWS